MLVKILYMIAHVLYFVSWWISTTIADTSIEIDYDIDEYTTIDDDDSQAQEDWTTICFNYLLKIGLP